MSRKLKEMNKCVYSDCMYHGFKDSHGFNKCELHKEMCDYTLDGKHACKLFSVTHFTDIYSRHGYKYNGYYCKEHGKMICRWISYYGRSCEYLAVKNGLCEKHICIEDDCQEVVHETEAESYLINDGYCETHYVGSRVKHFH